ncbi:hypothetical protein VPH35_036937 [Triticum aestivum]
MHRNFVLHLAYWYMCDVFPVMNILVCAKFMYDYPRSSTTTHDERSIGEQLPGCSSLPRQAVQFRLCEQRGSSFFLTVDSALVWCILSQLLGEFFASLTLCSTGYIRKWSFFRVVFSVIHVKTSV